MSNADVTLVKSMYEAFGRGEIETVIAALTPDVDWQVYGSPKDAPTIGRWKGPKGVQEFFRTLAENQDATEFAPRDFYAAADKVFVLGRYGWRVRKSGKPAGGEWCHVFTFRDGKVSRFQEYTDTASFAHAYRD